MSQLTQTVKDSLQTHTKKEPLTERMEHLKRYTEL